MPGPAAVQVVGLTELRRGLRDLDDPKGWNRELGKVSRKVGTQAAGWAQAEARSMGGPFSHFANAIRGGGGAAGVKVRVAKPAANATFWGSESRTGWYANPRYDASTGRQHPRWVGNTWPVGDPVRGPYAINPAIASHLDQIVNEFAEGIGDLTRRAFPD
jgi:hypothetical protein